MKASRFVATLLGLLLALTSVHRAQQAPDSSAQVALQSAIKIETIDGNLKGAINAYIKIVAQYPKSRRVAAEALARMAGCYEKLGAAQSDEARKAYERLVREFSDQAEFVAQARTRLLALPASTNAPGVGVPRVHLTLDASGSGLYDLSSDGRYFAYSTTSLRATVRVRDLATGNEREVSLNSDGESGSVGKICLSPDGRHLAYAWFSPVTGQEIRVVSTLGGSSHPIAKMDGLLAWSPDGKEVYAFARTDPANTGSDLSLTAISVSEGATRPLSGRFRWDQMLLFPRVSPDGRYMASSKVGSDPAKEIFLTVTDLSTGKDVRITDGANAERSPIWSRDGSRVLFVQGRSGESTLWSVPIVDGHAGGAPVFVRSFQRTADTPTGAASDPIPLGVSADGTFYYLHAENAHRRYVVGVEPGYHVPSESSLADLPMGCGYGYGWASDSRSIAVIVPSAAGTASNSLACIGDRILLRSIVGGADRLVNPGVQQMQRPRWSPEGKRILVTGHQDGTYGAFAIDVASGAATLLVKTASWLATNENNVPAFDWSADGQSLIIGRRTQAGGPAGFQIVLRDLASGEETVRYSLLLSQGSFWPSQTSVGSDGNIWLLGNMLNDDKSTTRAAIIIPAGGGEARVAYGVKKESFFSAACVSGDGKGVWVSQRKASPENPSARELLWVPADGGQPVHSGLAMAGLDGLVASPDGSKLLLYRNSVVEQLWSVETLPAKGALGARR